MRERRAVEALLGTYVATVLVPAAALLAGGPVAGVRDAGVLVAAGLLIAAVVAGLARTVDELATAVTTPPVVVASVLPPLGYLPYMIWATAPESTAALLSVVGIFAVIPGILVPVAGAAVESRRARRTATEEVVVTVGDGEDDGGLGVAAGAGLAVAGVALVGAGVFVLGTGDGDVFPFVTMLGGLSTLLTTFADDDTEVAVTDVGIRLDRSFTRWESLAGYRVTDDAVELVRPEWYHPTRELSRDEMADGDEETLQDGLADHLPRLDEEGRVVQVARR